MWFYQKWHFAIFRVPTPIFRKSGEKTGKIGRESGEIGRKNREKFRNSGEIMLKFGRIREKLKNLTFLPISPDFSLFPPDFSLFLQIFRVKLIFKPFLPMKVPLLCYSIMEYIGCPKPPEMLHYTIIKFNSGGRRKCDSTKLYNKMAPCEMETECVVWICCVWCDWLRVCMWCVCVLCVLSPVS